MPYKNIGNTQFNPNNLSDPDADRVIQRRLGLDYLIQSMPRNTRPDNNNSTYPQPTKEQTISRVDNSIETLSEPPRESTFVPNPTVYDTAQQDRVAVARANMASVSILIDPDGALSGAPETPHLDSEINSTEADKVGGYEMTQVDHRPAA